MKKLLILSLAAFLFACKSEKKTTPADTDKIVNGEPPAPPIETTTAYTPTTNTDLAVEGKEIKLSSSILVDKDKNKLKADAPYRAMITTSSGPENEGLILRFVFDTKPGAYPLTGFSYGRGKGDAGQQFGGLLGGQEKLYPNTVTLTEVKDLGENGAGGHRWSISGTIENDRVQIYVVVRSSLRNEPVIRQFGEDKFGISEAQLRRLFHGSQIPFLKFHYL